MLQRVSQRTDEVEIGALAPDSQLAARWLKRLEHARDVQSVEVVEMKQRAERYEFTALVRYQRSEKPVAKQPVRTVKGGAQ